MEWADSAGLQAVPLVAVGTWGRARISAAGVRAVDCGFRFRVIYWAGLMWLSESVWHVPGRREGKRPPGHVRHMLILIRDPNGKKREVNVMQGQPRDSLGTAYGQDSLGTGQPRGTPPCMHACTCMHACMNV